MAVGKSKTIRNLYSTVNVCPIATAKGIYYVIGDLQSLGIIPMNFHNMVTEVQFIISGSLTRKL